jgi:hypothetical protein
VVEITHLGLNTRVLYLRLIILLVEDNVPIDNDALLIIDSVNLKIKSAQSFKDAHRNRVCVYGHINN